MLSYTKLWVLLEKKGMKKTDLTKNKIVSPATLAKLGKNENINSNVIEKICEFLKCQPGDIMEYINEEDVRNVMEKIDTANKVLFDTLKKNGVTEEQFESLMSQALKSMFAGDYSMVKMFEDVKKQEETE